MISGATKVCQNNRQSHFLYKLRWMGTFCATVRRPFEAVGDCTFLWPQLIQLVRCRDSNLQPSGHESPPKTTRPGLYINLATTLKMGPPQLLLLFTFDLFNQHYNFATKYVKKCPSSVRCRNSNPLHSKHESPPITTRPGLHNSLALFLFTFGLNNQHYCNK